MRIYKLIKIDLTGQVFGKLQVIAESGLIATNGKTLWACHCDCKNFCLAKTAALRNGKTDCGCENKNNISVSKRKHGFRGTKIYSVADGAIRRCHDVNKDNYPHYGGRGITVCDEWRYTREKFCQWLLDNGYRDGLQLDRKDNDKGYSPENCRLIPNSFNGINKRGSGKIGCAGVFYKKECIKNPYLTMLRLYGKEYKFGYYTNLFDACAVRIKVTSTICNEVAEICKKYKDTPVEDLKPMFIEVVNNFVTANKTV